MPLSLPERASYEFLKKLAKERLAVLRAVSPTARLAAAQLAIAREYGFSSWRALKQEIDRRREPRIAEFMRACRTGDTNALAELLKQEPDLAREKVAAGTTGLHLAIRHPDALRLLLQNGADPNARDEGDNASALHFAAAQKHIESVRVLLDAGADVHGAGDLHLGNVIGWAAGKGNEAVVDLLLARGARHHIFSAMALGDHDLVERLVEEDPDSLSRRRSRYECGQTPLHAAFAPPDGLGCLTGRPDYVLLALLIDLGADLEAKDDKGRTPLDVAVLRGDTEAARILRAGGAIEPEPPAKAGDDRELAQLADSVRKSDPMFVVQDMRATLQWYRAIGFTINDEYEDSGDLIWASLSFGKCEFTLSTGATTGPRDVSLWLYTDRVEELYRQLRTVPGIPFEEDLHTPFYGGQQFSIRDLNGLHLVFLQPTWLAPRSATP